MRTFTLLTLTFLLQLSLEAQVKEAKLLGTWSDINLPGSAIYDNTYNEVWGVEVNDVEYAIIGTTEGTHFIDLSDPTDPKECIRIRGGSTGPIIIHRDYHDHNGFLYAVSDEGNNSTLQIMDLSYLPDSVPVVYDSKALIRRSHNIFIDTSSSIMYSCISDGDSLQYVGLRLFDVSDPYNPEAIAAYAKIDGQNFNHVHDAYVRNDTAYLNCGNDGFFLADFSDPTFAKMVSTLFPWEYPQSGYNHSGWLSDDGQIYVMADETWGTDLKIIDVSDPTSPSVINTINAGNENRFSIAHNQIIHGDYLYCSYYYDGLQIWDISDPMSISRILEYKTSNIAHNRSYEGAWGVYPFLKSGLVLVSDMQEGLFVFDSVENSLTNSATENPISSQWQMYPNPSPGEVLISSDLPRAQLEISTTDGKKIISEYFSENKKLQLAKGTYIVSLSTSEYTSSKLLLIEEN